MPMRRYIGPRHSGEIACKSGRAREGGTGGSPLIFNCLWHSATSPAVRKIIEKSVKLVIYTAILLYGIYSVFTGCGTLKRGVNMARRRSAYKAQRGRVNKAHSEEHVYGVAGTQGLSGTIAGGSRQPSPAGRPTRRFADSVQPRARISYT